MTHFFLDDYSIESNCKRDNEEVDVSECISDPTVATAVI